jgi:hypothetical protein
MSFESLLATLGRFLSPSAGGGRALVPEWEGWLVLGLLLAVFGLLLWWLYLSELPDRLGQSGSAMSGRARLALGALVLLSGVLFTAGARWDELWHRLYGGFGDDFLWPPHLMIYGSLGLNSAFAGLGLARAARGTGGIRERFRANPLVGLLGLLSAYQLASIPSDLTWHKIIGPDISAWSLPHLLLLTSTSAVLLTGMALILSTRPPRSWRIGGRLEFVDGVVIALLVVSTLSFLQFGVTEWEWRSSSALPFDRPAWMFPVVVLAIGIAEAHLVLYGLRRIGAATIVAVVALVFQVAWNADARAALPPGPLLVSHLLLVLPAVALDLWYVVRFTRVGAASTLVGGVGLFGIVFLLESFVWLGDLMPYPTFSAGDVAVTVALGVPAALVIAGGARLATTWLSDVGTRPTADRPRRLGSPPLVQAIRN